MSITNGGPVEAPASNPGPQLMVLAQYIKDLSFENPSAPGSLQKPTQPQINVSVNVLATPLTVPKRHARVRVLTAPVQGTLTTVPPVVWPERGNAGDRATAAKAIRTTA